jgi:hypothetical protein
MQLDSVVTLTLSSMAAVMTTMPVTAVMVATEKKMMLLPTFVHMFPPRQGASRMYGNIHQVLVQVSALA